MSERFEHAHSIIQQRAEAKRWSHLNVIGWRYVKLSWAFYLMTAVLLPVVVGLLVWGLPS